MKRDLLPVARALKRNLPSERWESVPDPRRPQGIRHALSTQLSLLVLGLVTNQRTLRDVERLGHQIAARRALRLRSHPSDTTMDRTVRQVNPSHLRGVLHEQVRAMERNKQLEPAIDFPYSLVAIDGKALGTDEARLHPESHRQGEGDQARYVLKALRAVHISSAVKPILDQQVIPAERGERVGFKAFLLGLRRTYGALAQCFTMDAGFWSLDLVMTLSSLFIPYIVALKGNAGSAYTFALHALGSGDQDPPKGWDVETSEKRGGVVIRRQLSRLDDDLGTYGAVVGVWRQRTRQLQGGKVIRQEDRYFATSLSRRAVTADQALAAVRAHWAIENDSNWTMDVILGEDTGAWVQQGTARETLCWLRMIAYNLLRLVRCRTLRAPRRKFLPWRAVLDEVRDALVAPDVWASGFS